MNPSVSFCGEILALGDREKKGCDFYKGSVEKNLHQIRHILRKTILNCHIYTIGSCIKKNLLYLCLVAKSG
jgi:hypothetical protein